MGHNNLIVLLTYKKNFFRPVDEETLLAKEEADHAQVC